MGYKTLLKWLCWKAVIVFIYYLYFCWQPISKAKRYSRLYWTVNNVTVQELPALLCASLTTPLNCTIINNTVQPLIPNCFKIKWILNGNTYIVSFSIQCVYVLWLERVQGYWLKLLIMDPSKPTIWSILTTSMVDDSAPRKLFIQKAYFKEPFQN